MFVFLFAEINVVALAMMAVKETVNGALLQLCYLNSKPRVCFPAGCAIQLVHTINSSPPPSSNSFFYLPFSLFLLLSKPAAVMDCTIVTIAPRI
jgi:hypothetical protein